MTVHHDVIKSVGTTIFGIAGTTYGVVTKALVSAQAVGAAAPLGGFRVEDISIVAGTVTTVASSLWTWYLLRRAEVREADRRDREKDADLVRREADRDAGAARQRQFDDAMARVQVMVAERMAAIEIHQAEIKAHLNKQDGDLAAVKGAVVDPAGVASPPATTPAAS